MIKKALVTLLSSAILATTVASGVVTTPTVAYAKETNIIKVMREDCISKDDLEQRGIDLEGVDNCPDILKASDSDTYFLVLSEYREDGLVVYQLDGSAVIETDERRYTVSYDGTSYNVTDVVNLKVEAEEDKKAKEKAKINKWISDMVVCKHQSAGNVTLSASEKKGTLTVTKADIKTATKLDMMLKSKKAVTIKVKSASKSKAVKQLERLQKLIGHANTYGIQFWTTMDKNNYDLEYGLPETYSYEDNKVYKNYIRSSQLKKSGSFYSIKISKLVSKNYTYICKAYENAFKRAEKRKTGYHFVKGTHLCDCSDMAKLRLVFEVIYHVYNIGNGGGGNLDWAKIDMFKNLATTTDRRYYGGESDIINPIYSNVLGASALYYKPSEVTNDNPCNLYGKLKDSSGKYVNFSFAGNCFGYNNNHDVLALNKILGTPTRYVDYHNI